MRGSVAEARVAAVRAAKTRRTVVGSCRGRRFAGVGRAPPALGIHTCRSRLGPRMCVRRSSAPFSAACTACPTMAA
eukprot:3854564-Prorocentrum_lima.AAC.1